MFYFERALELVIVKECTGHAMDASTLNIKFSSKYLWEDLERLNRKK